MKRRKLRMQVANQNDIHANTQDVNSTFARRVVVASRLRWVATMFCVCVVVVSDTEIAIAQRNADQPGTLGNRFPFVIRGDDTRSSVTDQRDLLHTPAGSLGFVRVEGEHFYAGRERIRFWGMNLCFSANFPPHEVADTLAPHLAKLGINAVRFHHLDTAPSPNGILKAPDATGQRRFDPELVDRFDYLLARLHENGIYADMNLHVGRTLSPEEGFPRIRDVPWWATFNKWVMYYDPSVQATVKDYSRELLLHENPYRDGRRRVDDPGIAIVEMLNENFFSKQGYGIVSKLPKRFRDSLVDAWNEWLSTEYSSTDQLVAAWFRDQPAEVAYLVPPADWGSGLDGWRVSKVANEFPRSFGGDPPGKIEPGRRAIRLQPVAVTEQDYQLQLQFTGFSTEKGKPLTLQYWVRADRERSYRVEVSTNQDGRWRDLGLYEPFQATSEWTKVQRVVLPGESIDGEAALRLNVGNSAIPIEFADVSLQRGAIAIPLPAEQTLETNSIGVPDGGSPARAHADMQRFMVATEKKWVAEFKRFLQEDLGVKVPITASQVNYHAAAVNLELNDFADLHNYWHHPIFPVGANWDARRWTVGNDPMEADPTRATWPAHSLLMRTGWRVKGKPMTLSEWNYPEPSLYSAGCVPMAAMIGALQDWDGIFFFDYDSMATDAASWNRDSTVNFFDFNGSPVKLAALPVFANLFLRGDLAPLEREWVAPFGKPASGELGLHYRLCVDADPSREATSPQSATRQSATSPSTVSPSTVPQQAAHDLDVSELRTPDGSVVWRSEPPGEGIIRLQTKCTQGLWGTISESIMTTAEISMQVEPLFPNYGILVATSMDRRPLSTSAKVLLFAGTQSENQGMGWNSDRTSVGTRWGDGPTTVTGINADIRLKRAGPISVYALDPDGKRMASIKVGHEGDWQRFQVSESAKTLWYEISAGLE